MNRLMAVRIEKLSASHLKVRNTFWKYQMEKYFGMIFLRMNISVLIEHHTIFQILLLKANNSNIK